MNIETAEKLRELLNLRDKYKNAELLDTAEYCVITFTEPSLNKIRDYCITGNKEMCQKIADIIKDENYRKLQEIDNKIKEIQC